MYHQPAYRWQAYYGPPVHVAVYPWLWDPNVCRCTTRWYWARHRDSWSGCIRPPAHRTPYCWTHCLPCCPRHVRNGLTVYPILNPRRKPPTQPIHDDVMIWKRCQHYWPLVRGIHRWPVDEQAVEQTVNLHVIWDVLKLVSVVSVKLHRSVKTNASLSTRHPLTFNTSVNAFVLIMSQASINYYTVDENYIED